MRVRKFKLSKVQKEIVRSFAPHLQQLKGELQAGGSKMRLAIFGKGIIPLTPDQNKKSIPKRLMGMGRLAVTVSQGDIGK